MDYNSRINWQPGMEVTVQTMQLMEEALDFRQRTALRLAIGSGARGIVTGTELRCHAVFVGRTVEITGLKLTAILPSGRLMTVDEDVRIAIEKEKIEAVTGDGSENKEVFLCVSIGNETTTYECEDIEFVRPKYVYDFCSLEEAIDNDCLPIVRLTVEDGVLSLDADYVLPVIIAADSERLLTLKTAMKEKMMKLTKHANLESSDLRVLLMQVLYQINAIKMQHQTTDFMHMVYEMATLASIYTEEYAASHELTAEKPELPTVGEPNVLKIDTFASEVERLLDAIGSVLDLCIVVDHSINFDDLKAQLKAELYEEMRPEINEKIEQLRTELHEQLTTELDQRIHQAIDDMEQSLHDKLRTQLPEEMRQPLYDALYDALYRALDRPAAEVVDNFMPLI